MATKKWDSETDLIIVGAGLAGFCAALQASEAGVSSVLLEKTSNVGGTSGMSGGLFAFAGTDLQKEQGIDDTDERLFDDLRRVGGFKNDESIVSLYVRHQLATYHWLKAHGVLFGHPEASAGQSVPRSHHTKSAQVIEALAARLESAGRSTVMRKTAATRLLREHDDGPVEGVLAESNGRTTRIKARRGVVLTSGGFSRNAKLLATFAPLQIGVNVVCGEGCDGDGLLMAWKLGADLRDMAYVKSTFGNHPDSGSVRHLLLFPVYRGAIAVNKAGKRFVNESLSYKLLGDACLQQPDGLAFQVFDTTVMEKTSPGVLTFDFQEAVDDGYMLKADTLAALAGKIGVDPAALAETVSGYNRRIAGGETDEFGRTSMSNQFGKLVELTRAPFYAYPSVNVMLGTYCGIGVNDRMEVIDVFGATIPNLYAAGEVQGGFHGAAYMTGSGLGKAAIFGRVAVATALNSALGAA
ncbi:MAG: FAD-dependent oxidoreductase [Proteobacteria bacterium]|nr:FAD-dependent oxidoreductase [Burkholderiales bacterium]